MGRRRLMLLSTAGQSFFFLVITILLRLVEAIPGTALGLQLLFSFSFFISSLVLACLRSHGCFRLSSTHRKCARRELLWLQRPIGSLTSSSWKLLPSEYRVSARNSGWYRRCSTPPSCQLSTLSTR
ncbi:hypothetical protein BJX70DRAFT_248948 [Aspergillus crustosus]